MLVTRIRITKSMKFMNVWGSPPLQCTLFGSFIWGWFIGLRRYRPLLGIRVFTYSPKPWFKLLGCMVSAESKQLENNLSRWSSILIILEISIWAGDQLVKTSLGWGWISKVASTKNAWYFFATSKNPYIKINKVLKGSQAMYESKLVFIRLMSFVY